MRQYDRAYSIETTRAPVVARGLRRFRSFSAATSAAPKRPARRGLCLTGGPLHTRGDGEPRHATATDISRLTDDPRVDGGPPWVPPGGVVDGATATGPSRSTRLHQRETS